MRPNDGLWDLNPQNGEVYYSPRWFSLLGFQPEELPQRYGTWRGLLHPEDRERAISELRRHTESRNPFIMEYRMRRKDGRYSWIQSRGQCVAVDDQGHAARLVGTHTDISERKEFEEKHQRLITAVEQSAESIVITNAEGVINYVNPAFEKITGYKRDEVLGHKPSLLKSGRQSRSFYGGMWQELNAGRIWKGRLINRKKEGSHYIEEATISPIRNPKQEITGYVAVKRDVTHEVELEKRFNQSQKLEAIGTLAGGIAHDFNNILQAILGYAELALGEAQGQQQLQSPLKEVIKAGRRAADLVAQILAFSRQDDQEQQPMRLQPVIKEALKLLRGTLPSTIEIRSYIKADCGPVMADPSQMHQVILNLCTNSFHAMRAEGGLLEVRLEELPLPVEFTQPPQNLRPGRYVCLSVKDNGYGMSADTLERAFEPYFTTKEKGEGTGLGLATVHGIVRSHHGAIHVCSAEQAGTAITIYLPLCSQPMNVGFAEAETPIPTGSGVILFVDDEESIVNMGCEALSRLGYTVHGFASSEAALAFFEKEPYRIDAVISDQTMPKLTGIDLARRLLAIRPELPVILCSGFSELITAEEVKAAGIREYLTKPVISRDYARALEAALKAAHPAHG